MKLISILETNDHGSGVCDSILEYLTKAHRALTRSDVYSPEGKTTLDTIYNSWRSDLMHGDMEAFSKSYDHYSAKEPDAFDELVEEMYSQAGLPPGKGTYEEFMKKVGG